MAQPDPTGTGHDSGDCRLPGQPDAAAADHRGNPMIHNHNGIMEYPDPARPLVADRTDQPFCNQTEADCMPAQDAAGSQKIRRPQLLMQLLMVRSSARPPVWPARATEPARQTAKGHKATCQPARQTGRGYRPLYAFRQVVYAVGGTKLKNRQKRDRIGYKILQDIQYRDRPASRAIFRRIFLFPVF